MSGSLKQLYLEKARAALAARAAWRSVFESDRARGASADASEAAAQDRVVGPASAGADTGTTCDKSDKSDKRPADGAAPEDEIAWRAEAMRPRVPPTGPIPPMYARCLPSPVPDDRCLSCGEPITPGNKYHCEPCVRAAWLVLREVRGRGGGSKP